MFQQAKYVPLAGLLTSTIQILASSVFSTLSNVQRKFDRNTPRNVIYVWKTTNADNRGR